MKLAIVHHHLNRGGVTQVILNQIRAIGSLPEALHPEQIVVLHGGRASGWNLPSETADRLRVELRVVDGLDYDDQQVGSHSLPESLPAALREIDFEPSESLLHIHNHSLGKNRFFCDTLSQLATHGYRELLQIHDFAEDFRPANYTQMASAMVGSALPFPSSLYPMASSIHYAVLTSRDHSLLARAGVPSHRLHLLPNPVVSHGELPDRFSPRMQLQQTLGVPRQRHLVVYPVRGIRRKNVGEATLWSAVLRDVVTVAITLPPINPAEQGAYGLFRSLAGSWELPIHFGTAETSGLTFLETLAAADSILTTSVGEGFGMVFLEAALAGRALVGRDLPEITCDFLDAGMRFGGLRTRIDIPLTWVGRARYTRMMATRFLRVARDFGLTESDFPHVDAAIDATLSDDLVDFARLDLSLQALVVQHVAQDAGRRAELRERNGWMLEAVTAAGSSRLRGTIEREIAINAGVAEQAYSLTISGRRLMSIYRELMESEAGNLKSTASLATIGHPDVSGPVSGLEGAESIRREMLAVERFYPICVDRRGGDEIERLLMTLSAPLEPIPTGHATRLVQLPDIRAVLFDVYGTIMISGSGDVGSAADRGLEDAWLSAMEDVGCESACDPSVGVEQLHQTIRDEHARLKETGIEYPEIDIVRIWWLTLSSLELCPKWATEEALGPSRGTTFSRDSRLGSWLKLLAVAYEARANPVWPMPGLESLLDQLVERGMLLGIISNAQFFTPQLFPALIDRSLEELGVDGSLQFYSYRAGIAKPGEGLYGMAAESLESRTMRPAQALYVGNDMFKDIWPAQSCGFRTALFAGDRRSLRLRTDHEQASSVKPDIVVDALEQLLQCI